MDGKTIFMNISSDNVIIKDGNSINLIFSRNNLENILGEELVKIYREISFQNVIILNGPGGFTNLRVGTLCLNILNSLLKYQISLFDVSKISLYEKAYKDGILPKLGIIYIGQKRNIWLRDFEKNEKIGQYTFDELRNININSDTFLDEVGDKSYYPDWLNHNIKLSISFNGKNIIINGTVIGLEDIKEIKSIAPNYMIEPSITLK